MKDVTRIFPPKAYLMKPHGVIIQWMSAFRRTCLSCEHETINLEKIDEVLTSIFSKKFDPGFSIRFEYYESFYICGRYGFEDFGEESEDINFIVPFDVGDKFVVVIESTEWYYWEENISLAFPAVAYSRAELQAWFAWSLNQIIDIFPEHKDELKEILDCHMDVAYVTDLMRRKLNGEPWAYGPARRREPKMLLWHQMAAHDKEMNEWIRRWL